jgi:hypothetical protein
MSIFTMVVTKTLLIAAVIYGVALEVEFVGNLLIAYMIILAVSTLAAAADTDLWTYAAAMPTYRKRVNLTVNIWLFLMLVAYGWWWMALLAASSSLITYTMMNKELPDDHRS